MKRTDFALAIVLFLAACAPSQLATSTSTPAISIVSPTPTNIPSPSSTSAPTFTPTLIPVPSATPRPKTRAADEWLGAGVDREKLFNVYIQTIKDGQVSSELGFKRLGTTFDKELVRAQTRFLQADTRLDVYYALLSLQRSIHDTHSSLTAPSGLTPPNETFSLPFTLNVRGNSLADAQYVVTQSTLPEIKAGFILKQYNSKTISQIEYDFSEWLDSSSPERLKVELARALTRTNPSRYSSPDTNLPVAIVFVDPTSQQEIRLSVTWQRGVTDTPSTDYANLALEFTGINYRVYKDAANQTLILAHASFNYNLRDTDLKNALSKVSYQIPAFDRAVPLENQRDWLAKFLEVNQHPNIQGIRNYPFNAQLEEIDTLALGRYLNQQNLSNLLIDVRENSGGSVPMNLIAMVAKARFKVLTRELVYVPLFQRDDAFLQESLTWTDARMRKIITDQIARDKTAVRSQRFPFDCKTAECKIDEAVFEPNANIRKFNLAILAGPGCVSSCDQFVAIIADNKIGTVVGLPSRGGHSPMRAKKEFQLQNGEKFSMIFTTGIGYRPNGEPLEGNPAQVDYYLFPEDNYLNKMIQHLQITGVFK